MYLELYHQQSFGTWAFPLLWFVTISDSKSHVLLVPRLNTVLNISNDLNTEILGAIKYLKKLSWHWSDDENEF